MVYQLRFESSARQQFSRLLPHLKQEFIKELEVLLDDPRPPYAKPLIREWSGAYRIQIDGQRLVYEVDDGDPTITIIRIARRDANTYP
jgi:mRNA interferase RelE/StbE